MDYRDQSSVLEVDRELQLLRTRTRLRELVLMNTLPAVAMTIAILSTSISFPILSAEDAVERVIFRSQADRSPILRSVSSDGAYLSHTAALVHRNAAGETQLYRQLTDQIKKPTWGTGWVQPIQCAVDGKMQLLISQLVDVHEKQNPFNQKMESNFENSVFGESGVQVARFPTIASFGGGTGSIRTSFFGSSGKLMVATKESSENYRLTEIDIKTSEKTGSRLVGRDVPGSWESAASPLLSPRADAFIRTSPLRLCRIANSDRSFHRIEGEAAKTLSGTWFGGAGNGRLALVPDGSKIFASYREGIVCWGWNKSMLAAITPPTSIKGGQLIAAIGNHQLLVACRGVRASHPAELNLIETKTNEVIATKKLTEILLLEPEHQMPVTTAGNGRFVIFRGRKSGMPCVMVFLIEQDAIQGPWYVLDPDNEYRLIASHLRASAESDVLAIESPGHGPKSLPRIVVVKLEKLIARKEE